MGHIDVNTWQVNNMHKKPIFTFNVGSYPFKDDLFSLTPCDDVLGKKYNSSTSKVIVTLSKLAVPKSGLISSKKHLSNILIAYITILQRVLV